MNLEQIYTYAYNFLMGNPLIALPITVGLAVFLWFKPWEFFKTASILLAFAGGFYFITELGNSAEFGAAKKKEITTEREENLMTN